MIKANELRIGNFVNYTNDSGSFVLIVKEILDNGINVIFNDGIWFIEYKDLNPIPLFCFCEVKYLHQLQNLYFALTGEYLQINSEILNGNTFKV